MTHDNINRLDAWLDQASPVPDMPNARIHGAAMDAFPRAKPMLSSWTTRFGALAATVVLGLGGFMAVQSYQAHQQAVAADADAFAEALLSETY
jgi:CHASE2 domain-containing sensor protein